MPDEFLIRAALGGALVAAVAGPLGCFVVWRRMAFFGDTMAHSGLLGVSLGLLAGIEPFLGVALVVVLAALALFWLERFRWLASDTVLGMLSHGSLALGLLAATSLPGIRLDLTGYLFGDILAIGRDDLLVLGIGGALALCGLAAIWRPLLALTVHADLARAEGVDVRRTRLVFALLVAVLVAGAMKVVGILLVTALLVVPAAAARRVSGTPEAMAVLASVIGVAAVLLGLGLSFWIDSPSGPSIVVAALALFAVITVAGSLVRPAQG
ncbi:MAG: metal ABC transporter permease [Pseudomonadota bacterium]|nr:metal ABC transporter permease [Pseudomonadota bacterium]